MYQTNSFQDLLEYMSSCEKLGFAYTVQKDFVEVTRWFGKKDVEPIYTLQLMGDDSGESQRLLHWGQSESL